MARSRCRPQSPLRRDQRCGEPPGAAHRFRHRGLGQAACIPKPSPRSPTSEKDSRTRTPRRPASSYSRSRRSACRRTSLALGGLRMRPLTLWRLLTHCGILAAVLFVVVVIALKLGAVPVSLYGLGRDLLQRSLSPNQPALQRIRPDHLRHSLAAHSPRHLCRRIALRRRHQLSSAAAQSSGRPVRSRRFQRRRPRRHPRAHRRASSRLPRTGCRRALHASRRFSRRRRSPSPPSISSAAAKVKLTAPLCSSPASFPLPFFQPSSCF